MSDEPTSDDGGLLHHSAAKLLSEIASDAPTPGGGSVSALTMAMGAALGEMVCALTQGRKKYAEVAPELAERGQKLARLRAVLTRAVDEDARAYAAVVRARKLPRETDDEKASRRTAIDDATWHATEVPLSVCELGVQILEELVPIAQKGNKNAITDAGVGARLVDAGVHGAALNVEVNLCCLVEDLKVKEYRASQEQLQERSTALSAQVAQIVDERM